MSYKHTKFTESETMRSLEKLAREKGWVKPEPITKQASSELDLTPSLNLTENIIKLCNGLKKAGFDKYAVELEDKLMAYKKAASLYEVSDEKGEDLVDAAHPKGSHKLEGVDSDEATVETILDQHLKLMEVINKKPHGKLASSRDVLNAVKIALGQTMPEVPADIYGMSEDELQVFRNWGAFAQLKQINNLLNQAKSIIQTKMNTTTLAYSFDNNYNDIVSKIDSLNQDTIIVKDIDDIIGDLGDIENSVKFFNWKDFAALSPLGLPGTLTRHVGDIADIATGHWDSTNRDKIMALVAKAKLYATTARSNVRGNNDTIIKSKLLKMQQDKTTSQSQTVTDTKSKIVADLTKYKSQMSGPEFDDEDRAGVLPLIDAQLKQLSSEAPDVAKAESFSKQLLNWMSAS